MHPFHMGEKNMKQLELNFGGHKTPSFETWYAENSTEKRKYGEKQYTPRKALEVYNQLIRNGFFTNGGFLK